ncbi:DUF6011 domain-containing protein [Frankia sp. Cj3]|uniref:DUF6011 domain-containing protein n=1 Tax=Frankia sp. Cj3 TaxID=2880976 RepID=UPI001EF58A89|nr:DUF6011 domain-containing protein [Frankia sp. Cj3]
MTESRYFAVPDLLDPAQMSYWYRPTSGRNAGQLAPWPPRRSRWGQLLTKDIPFDPVLDPKRYRHFVCGQVAAINIAKGQVDVIVGRDPDTAAARFAALTIRCCRCGKQLSDARSKIHGVGPECRSGMSADLLGLLADAVRAAHGEYARTQEGHHA